MVSLKFRPYVCAPLVLSCRFGRKLSFAPRTLAASLATAFCACASVMFCLSAICTASSKVIGVPALAVSPAAPSAFTDVHVTEHHHQRERQRCQFAIEYAHVSIHPC